MRVGVVLLLAFRLVVSQRCPNGFVETEWPRCDPYLAGGHYSMAHNQFSNWYYECHKGVAQLMQCPDGFVYNDQKGCVSEEQETSGSFVYLQGAANDHLRSGIPTQTESQAQVNIAVSSVPVCPTPFALIPHPDGCEKFYKCFNSTAYLDSCTDGLVFDIQYGCRDAYPAELKKCHKPALVGCALDSEGNYQNCSWFDCPVSDNLKFGDHSRHPYPNNCRYFLMCLRNGAIKLGGCPEGTAFYSPTSTCEPEHLVPGCRKQLLDTNFEASVTV